MKDLRVTAATGKETSTIVIVFAIALLGWMVAAGGCRRAPEEPAWFHSPETGEVLGPEALGEIIQDTDCLFRIDEMKRELIFRGGEEVPEIMAALNRRRDRLVEETEAFSAVPGALDFLGWRIRPTSEVPGREWETREGRYEISGYFVVTGEMDRNWIFRIMTKVDDQHVHLLPPERQQARYINWQIFPRTSDWSPGEHHILSTIMDLQPIPYYIYARMYLYPEFINQPDFAYGWFAGSNVEPVPEDKPPPR